MSRPKEVSFFQDTIDFAPNPNYEKGWAWYKQAFAHYQGEPVIGEATPSYSDRSRSPQTARRIHNFNPEMKIVYMVRDPLTRQISTWKMQYAFGIENAHPHRREERWALRGFPYWLRKQFECGQWDECRYIWQLAIYRKFFPESQIALSLLEDWKTSRIGELVRLMRFLGLDARKWDETSAIDANRGVDRTIERPIIKRIRQSTYLRSAVRLLPSVFRDWARARISRCHIAVPEPELDCDAVHEFCEYVSEDARELLATHQKKPTCWHTLANAVQTESPNAGCVDYT